MRRIFLSYSRHNGERAQILVRALEREGLSVWLDNKDIPVSVSWYEEAKSAIEAADVVVECRSPAWEKSVACDLEHRHAAQLGKQVVGVAIETDTFETVMGRILDAVRACSALVDAHTDVIVRSRHWDDLHRPAGLLFSGDSLQRARDLVARGTPALDALAREFVARSRRRQRTRRRWIALAAVVVFVLATTYGTSVIAGYAVDQTIANSTEGFSELSREVDPDVFREMANAAAQVRDNGAAFAYRVRLVEALDVTTPAKSYLVGDGAAVRLVEPLSGVPATTPDEDHSCCPQITAADGRRITGAESGALLIGDKAAWQGANALSGAVKALASTPELFAVAHASDGVVKLLSSTDFSNQGTLVVRGAPGALAFSHTGRYLAVGFGAEVALFDTRSGRQLTTLRGSIGDVRQLVWSPQDDEVWAVAGNHRLSAWRWRHGRVLLDDPRTWFVSIAGPLADGRFVAVSRDGRLQLIEVEGGPPLVLYTSARDVVTAAASSRSSTVAVGTQHSVVLYNLSSRTEREIELENCTPVGLSYSTDSNRLYAACLKSNVVLAIDPNAATTVATNKVQNASSFSVITTASGAVRVGTSEGKIVEFDRDLKRSREVLGDSCGMPIRAMSHTADGAVMVFTGDGAGILGCMLNGRFDGQWTWNNYVVRGHTGRMGRAIGLRADGKIAAMGFSDGTVAFWSPDSELPSGSYHDFAGEVRGLQFTGDGRDIVVATNDGLLELMPVCELCQSTLDLATVAERRVEDARRMGLTS
jgi:WD40 repeat protein